MFWKFNSYLPNDIIFIDENIKKEISFQLFKTLTNSIANKLSTDSKKLILLNCENSFHSVSAYCACLQSNNVCMLVDSKTHSLLKQNLIDYYQPEIIISFYNNEEFPSYKKEEFQNIFFHFRKNENEFEKIFDDLAILLSTSGTTGSPKLVRLSYNNLQSNAEAIFNYLKLNKSEVPITSLPISYSYGLSVINSHLEAGTKIVLTNKSIVQRDFWKIFSEYKCTSIAGVPYHYHLLQKLKFESMHLPSLKVMTQAGGKLNDEYIKYFLETSIKKKLKFFVMYGQTEATARISYVPFEMLLNKIGSIGIPIPNGELKLIKDEKIISNNFVEGELTYFGKNVMLGYAESRTCLTKGDELNGKLQTSDIGFKDDDDFFYITGRLKRFIKIFGLRLNLDEIEKMIENNFLVSNACVGNDDLLKIYIEKEKLHLKASIKNKVIDLYKIHHSFVEIIEIDSIPVTNYGKKDYNSLIK